MRSSRLISITDSTIIYARPDGGHYHLNRNCPMLQGNQFKYYGYTEIKKLDIKKRKLRPCICCFEDFVEHKLVREIQCH
jgi:hypothetical protein